MSVQATDNAGQVSEITNLSKATVVVGRDIRWAPIVRMTELVPGGFEYFPRLFLWFKPFYQCARL